MATQLHLDDFIQGDDAELAITITLNGAAYNLTGRRIEILVKASRVTPDASQLYRLSTVGASPAIVITNAAGGLAVATLTDRLVTAGTFWYRAWTAATADDTVDRKTFNYGNWTIRAA